MHPKYNMLSLRASVWFGCFLFLLSDENVFGWISKDISSKNENRKQSENENNKFLFLVFSVENRNLISDKMKLRDDNECNFKQI